MNLQIDQISKLIAKYATQSLSESEERILNEWLKDSYNKLQFEKILNSYEDSVSHYKKINTTKAWNNVLRNSSEKKSWYRESSSKKGVRRDEEPDQSDLLSKFISSGLSDAEKEYLEVCLKKTSSQKMGQLHESDKNKKRVTSWLAYAATILLPVGLAALVFILNKEVTDSRQIVSETILNEQKNVILELDNGEQYTFNHSDTLVETSQGKLNIDSAHLSFQRIQKEMQSKLKFNTLTIPKGMQYQLSLSDGTKVWLNAQTKFKYPIVFTGTKREVFLDEGEIYLEVYKNKNKPFIVHVDHQQVKVLGTQFNVKSYQNEETNQITLVEGSVLVSNEKNAVKLLPDQQAVFYKNNQDVMVKNVNAQMYGAWKDKMFIYRNASLDQIMTDLQRHYNVKVFYQDQQLQKETFSVSIDIRENFTDIIEMMEATGSVHFDVKNNILIIKK